jgi:hypothetical protein
MDKIDEAITFGQKNVDWKPLSLNNIYPHTWEKSH